MATKSASPWDVMTGTWTGTSKTFDRTGIFQPPEQPSVAVIRWDGPIMVFEQFTIPRILSLIAKHGSLAAVSAADVQSASSAVDKIEFRFTVDGNVATAENAQMTNYGVTYEPGIFLFNIQLKADPSTIFSNNQYFVGSNVRNIIGPLLVQNQIYQLNYQVFTRVSP